MSEDSLKQKALEEMVALRKKQGIFVTALTKRDKQAIETTLRVVFLWAEKKEKEAEIRKLEGEETAWRLPMEHGKLIGKLELLRDLKQKTKGD